MNKPRTMALLASLRAGRRADREGDGGRDDVEDEVDGDDVADEVDGDDATMKVMAGCEVPACASDIIIPLEPNLSCELQAFA